MTIRILFLSLLACLLFAGASAHAQSAPQSIAIVDVEKILAESKASQSLKKQIEAKKESFQKEFAAKEKELKTTETSLMGEREKLSAEEFAKRRKAYEEKILETRKLYQKSRNSLDQALNSSMGELRKNIVQATSEVASAKNYTIVLSRETVLIADKTIDITTEVLQKLDAKITDIKLKAE